MGIAVFDGENGLSEKEQPRATVRCKTSSLNAAVDEGVRLSASARQFIVRHVSAGYNTGENSSSPVRDDTTSASF